MKKNRVTAPEIEKVKTKIWQPINTEWQNPADARVKLENLTPEHVESTIEKIRHGNYINNINQPVQRKEWFVDNETFVVENKETIEEKKLRSWKNSSRHRASI